MIDFIRMNYYNEREGNWKRFGCIRQGDGTIEAEDKEVEHPDEDPDPGGGTGLPDLPDLGDHFVSEHQQRDGRHGRGAGQYGGARDTECH